MNVKILLAFLLISLVSGCSQNQNKISLRLSWIPSATYSGDFIASKNSFESNSIHLEVKPGGVGINTITQVATGQDEFGVIAADELFLANDNGAELVIIGVANYINPGAFVSREGSDIFSPSDFKGKSVGMLPFGSTNLLYEAMMQRNKIDRDQVKELTVSPDVKPFIAGEYDIHPVFAYDETITLTSAGVKYNLIEPSTFGIDFIGPVYFTTKSFYESNPEKVRLFIELIAKGWQVALNDKELAIKTLKSISKDVDEERERKVLDAAEPYFTGYKNQPLNSDIEKFKNMVNIMFELEKLKTLPEIESSVNLEYIQKYYSENQ